MRKAVSLFFLALYFIVNVNGQGKKFTDYPSITTLGTNDVLLTAWWNGSAWTTNKQITATNMTAQMLGLAGQINVVSNNTAVYGEIDLGSGTNFVFDPLRKFYRGTATANFFLTLGTNTVTDPAKDYDIYFACYDATGFVGLPYGALASADPRGNPGTNIIGTNIIHFYWTGGVWHWEEDTSKIPITQIAQGSANQWLRTIGGVATWSPFKINDYKDFVFPGRVDGTGCTITTNDYTSGLWGLATHAGTGGTNANYAIYKIGTVPLDLDTSVTMVLKNLAFRVSGTDTGSSSFSISYFSPASSSAASPSDYTALSGYVTFTSGTLTSPAAGDIFYMADVTLTGWASGLTSGRPLIVGIARDGSDANNDSISIIGGTILYGRTQ